MHTQSNDCDPEAFNLQQLINQFSKLTVKNMVVCIKQSRLENINIITLLITFTVGFICHKFGVRIGLFVSESNDDTFQLQGNKNMHALGIGPATNSFEKWLKQTPIVRYIDAKKGLNGKEDHVGLTLIVENALVQTNTRRKENAVSNTGKDPSDKERQFYKNNLLWANTLKSKRGWIFNNLCPSTCPETKRPILWGSRESLCPMMFRPEMKLFMRHLLPDKRVLEFGSGISTLYYSQCVAQYDSIEENEAWCTELLDHVPPKAKIHCMKSGASYEQVLDKLCISMPDLVLIDGGNRPKIAKAILPIIGELTDVFVHDFQMKRLRSKNYIDILKWYDLVGLASPSLAKFRIKKEYLQAQDQQGKSKRLCP